MQMKNHIFRAHNIRQSGRKKPDEEKEHWEKNSIPQCGSDWIHCENTIYAYMCIQILKPFSFFFCCCCLSFYYNARLELQIVYIFYMRFIQSFFFCPHIQFCVPHLIIIIFLIEFFKGFIVRLPVFLTAVGPRRYKFFLH